MRYTFVILTIVILNLLGCGNARTEKYPNIETIKNRLAVCDRLSLRMLKGGASDVNASEDCRVINAAFAIAAAEIDQLIEHEKNEKSRDKLIEMGIAVRDENRVFLNMDDVETRKRLSDESGALRKMHSRSWNLNGSNNASDNNNDLLKTEGSRSDGTYAPKESK
jgi:hypothetical protein